MEQLNDLCLLECVVCKEKCPINNLIWDMDLEAPVCLACHELLFGVDLPAPSIKWGEPSNGNSN